MRVSYTHEVPMGHRLLDHPGNCRYAHGHNYMVSVELVGVVSGDTGMVVDFSHLKRAVRSALEPFDHAFVVQAGDPLAALLAGHASVRTLDDPPTAEVLATLWRQLVCQELQMPAQNIHVTVHETRDCAVSL